MKNQNSSQPCLTSGSRFPNSAITKERKHATSWHRSSDEISGSTVLSWMKDGSWTLRFGRRICSSATPLSAHSVHKGTQLLDGFRSTRHCYAWDTVLDSCLLPISLCSNTVGRGEQPAAVIPPNDLNWKAQLNNYSKAVGLPCKIYLNEHLTN